MTGKAMFRRAVVFAIETAILTGGVYLFIIGAAALLKSCGVL